MFSLFDCTFFTAVLMEKALKDIMERLNVMHIKISIQIGFHVLTAIQRRERSYLSKGYATHAGLLLNTVLGHCQGEWYSRFLGLILLI